MRDTKENKEALHPNSLGGFRFGIMYLFYGIALVSSGLAVMGLASIGVSLVVITFWVIAFQCIMSRKNLGCLVLILLAAIILVGMLVPAVQQVRESSRRTACLNNMRQIILAFHNYESAYDVFPTACVTDDNKNPMHSWRVLILPFIEENALHAMYKFDEPWDGPNNSKLAAQCPRVYQCPSAPPLGDKTIYKLVTGPGTAFPADKRVGFDDVPDGSSNTIVLIEDPINPVNWMKPEDVSIDEAIKVITGLNAQHAHRDDSLLKTVYKGSNAAILDGSVLAINPMVDPELLRRSMYVNDGFSPDLRFVRGPYVVHKPQGYIALAVYLFLLALPGWFLWKKVS